MVGIAHLEPVWAKHYGLQSQQRNSTCATEYRLILSASKVLSESGRLSLPSGQCPLWDSPAAAGDPGRGG